jgi:hypothetical protein
MSLKLHDVNVVHCPKKFRVTRPLPLLFGLFFWPAFSLASKFGVAVVVVGGRRMKTGQEAASCSLLMHSRLHTHNEAILNLFLFLVAYCHFPSSCPLPDKPTWIV